MTFGSIIKEWVIFPPPFFFFFFISCLLLQFSLWVLWVLPLSMPTKETRCQRMKTTGHLIFADTLLPIMLGIQDSNLNSSGVVITASASVITQSPNSPQLIPILVKPRNNKIHAFMIDSFFFFPKYNVNIKC